MRVLQLKQIKFFSINHCVGNYKNMRKIMMNVKSNGFMFKANCEYDV